MKQYFLFVLTLIGNFSLFGDSFFGNYPYTLPPLPYAHDALEPSIDAETMRIHHEKHHQAYVDGLNAALAKSTKYQKKNLAELLEDWDDLPKDIRTAVRNHGGGHYNHSLFWLCMAPNARVEPEGALKKALVKQWGSYAQFKEAFSAAAKTVFGSGWAWLVTDDNGKLSIVTTQNQDTPLDDDDITPLLCLDVWEHAYYLKHQNKRGDYISAWWNVINWPFVEERYKTVLQK
jgi:superoxide dismutase, Fe-Mn family